jgi:hypothetical protein
VALLSNFEYDHRQDVGHGNSTSEREEGRSGSMSRTANLLHRSRHSRRLRWPVLGTAAFLVASCQRAGVLDPQGPIASSERLLLINSTAIMLVGA